MRRHREGQDENHCGCLKKETVTYVTAGLRLFCECYFSDFSSKTSTGLISFHTVETVVKET
jgi:hypothetical protein